MIEVEVYADHLPPAGVRRVTRWVLTRLEVDDIRVRVGSTQHWYHHGHFYGCAEGDLLLAYVPLEINGVGHDRGLRGGPPVIFPADWRESLVCILAHEGTHARQYRAGPRTKPYTQNRRGKIVKVNGRMFSEVEAEWAEYRYLKWWRERRAP